MSWDEPRAIASRLATALGVSLHDQAADDGVLLVPASRLDALGRESLRGTAALVVSGPPSAATSNGLATLRDAVAALGLFPALATFATCDADEVPLVVGAPVDDARVPELLAAGPHALTLDPICLTDGSAAQPARVCVVSFELAGMTGGGIGTASTALAESLAGAGHDVTFLFTGWQEKGTAPHNDRWRARCAGRGVHLAFVREPGAQTVKSPHFQVRAAYEVYCWLRRQEPFDVVHLPDNMGQGVYAQAAKRQGLAFADTTFVIGTHGPTRWAAEANRVALTREEFLVNDALERATIAHADVLLGPSRYLHDHLRHRGWQLPARVHVQPYATPSAVRTANPQETPPAAATPPSEIVFFGRIETRKGVVTLCDALDLLADGDGPRPERVTFLGPLAQVRGEPAAAYLAARARRWSWPWQIIDGRDQRGAADYLARPGVLAVMPSLVDNAPNTVSEAIALGVPFVASGCGGTGELVAALQRDDHMFGAGNAREPAPALLREPVEPSDPRPLAELLRRRLTTTVPVARPAFRSEAVDAAYDRWHRAVRSARHHGAPSASGPVATALPSLAVCVLFDGDTALLDAQLAALDRDVELVVADVRSEATGGDPLLVRDASVVRSERPGDQTQARAAAAAATHAELFAIVPAGEVPLPTFAETLRRVAATGAEVCSWAVLDTLDSEAQPSDRALHAYVPLPGPPLAGLSHHAFATGAYAIRRSVLQRLGGFRSAARGEAVDHDLLNRAVIGGLRIEVIPTPLTAKRRADGWSAYRAGRPGRSVAPYDAADWLAIERPFIAAGADGDLIALLRGARAEAEELRERLYRQHDAYEQRFVEQRTWIDNLEAEAVELRRQFAMLRAARSTALRIRRRAARALGSAGRRERSR